MTCKTPPNNNYDSRITDISRYKNGLNQKPEVKTGGPAGGGTNNAAFRNFRKAENAYPHESTGADSNGSWDSAVNTDYITDKIPLNLQFQPNMLDAYDVVTYHWKLFIVNQKAATTGEVFNQKHQTIIAETGVSDLTIDKVEINSLATPSIESGTGTSINVKFEILEPAGAGLIDKIFYQSIAMGIGNWNVMPFYLQLQFKGRSPESSEAEDGAPGSIGNLKWLWTLKLTSIKANVTTVGTRYEFSALIYNELAQSNAYFTLQQPMVLTNLTTFEKAMGKLMDKLNEDQFYKLIDNNGIPDSYRIVVDPEIALYNITPVNANTNSVRSNSTTELHTKNATFPAGVAIDKIIDSLLSQTDEYQKSMLGAGSPGAEGKTMKAEKSQMKSFWRIVTESRPIVFDPRRVDYAREFTIYVFKYDIGILDSNSFQDSAPPDTIRAERKRLATYADKSILKKKYNYIYTGLNDQIINFDIKINNAFASAVARMGGIYYNAAMHDMGVVAQEHAAEEAKITAQIGQTMSFLNVAASFSSDSTSASAAADKADASLAESRDAINNVKLPEARREQLRKILSSVKADTRLNFVRQAQAAATLEQSSFIARDLATPRSKKVEDTDLRFISDVDQNGFNAKQAYADYVKMLKGKLRPIARVDSMHQRQIGSGIESNSNSGIQKLSSMFAVALHSNLDGSYAQTTMTIKGDPFWLYPQPYTDNNARIYNSLKPDDVAINNIRNGHKLIADSVNLFGTDNFIIIRFRTPKIYSIDNNSEGEESITDVESFSGLFKVVRVTSRFEGGKFHQDLHCQLDPNLNILNFSDEIDAANKVPDLILPATGGTNNIPAEFSKNPRIFAANNAVGQDTGVVVTPVVRGVVRGSTLPEINRDVLRRPIRG